MSGWVKLHRKTLDNPRLMLDNDYWAVWTKLLLLVEYAPKKAYFKGKTIDLLPGQIITTRMELCEVCAVSGTKLERILNWLESEQQIEQQTTNRNRCISIVNWNKYQEREQPTGQQPDNNRTTTGQRYISIKEIEEVKEEEEGALQKISNTNDALVAKHGGQYNFRHWIQEFVSQYPEVSKIAGKISDYECQRIERDFRREHIETAIKNLEGRAGVAAKYRMQGYAIEIYAKYAKADDPNEKFRRAIV
jgi:hypothetical protein